ncbi:MAG: hypothetical protein IKI99_00610, partial [Firmicutes bacterium]|nr:hypothetical protein [Bacillota bacterium]
SPEKNAKKNKICCHTFPSPAVYITESHKRGNDIYGIQQFTVYLNFHAGVFYHVLSDAGQV